MVEGLGLPVEKIGCCERGCMIYWGVNRVLRCCKLCGHPRHKSRRRESTKHNGDVPYKKMLGHTKVTKADADEINSNIIKTSDCGWRKRSIF